MMYREHVSAYLITYETQVQQLQGAEWDGKGDFIYSPACLPDPRRGRADKRDYNQVYIASTGTGPRYTCCTRHTRGPK